MVISRGKFDWKSEENIRLVQALKNYDADTRECIKIVILGRIAEELQHMDVRQVKR